MFRRLVPQDRRLRTPRDRIDSQQPLGRKTCGLAGQPVQSRDKQSGHKEHHKTESGLRRDQRMHRTAAAVRIFAALQRASRFDGRRAQRGRQPE
jgi:hypothetical protein